MSKIIYDCKFLRTELIENKRVFVNTWSTEDMEPNDFMKCMQDVADLCEKYQPRGIVVNTKQFRFTIPVEVQEWYDKTIVPIHIDAGIKKMAFVMNEDILTQVSIELTMEEEKAAQAIDTKFFATVEDALAWM